MYLRESRGGIHSFAGFGDDTSSTASSSSTCARTAPSADGLSMECIDAQGNVLSSVPISTPNAAAAAASAANPAVFLGLTQNELMLAGVALGALILFGGKRKGR